MIYYWTLIQSDGPSRALGDFLADMFVTHDKAQSVSYGFC